MSVKVTDLTVEELREIIREEIAKSRVNDLPVFVPCYKWLNYKDCKDYQIVYTDRTEGKK